MTCPLNTIALDQRGAAFIAEHLSGVNMLCTALLDVVRSSPGRVFTTVPADTSFQRAHDFASCGLLRENFDLSRAQPVGGGLMTPVTSLREVRARHLLDFMRSRAGAICLIDDYNPRWSEPRAFDLGPTAFGVGEEVYHWADAAFGVEALTDLLAATDTIWHGVAAVCEAEPPGSPPTAEWLRRSAERVLEVNCTAYDGEGFICWRREGAQGRS